MKNPSLSSLLFLLFSICEVNSSSHSKQNKQRDQGRRIMEESFNSATWRLRRAWICGKNSIASRKPWFILRWCFDGISLSNNARRNTYLHRSPSPQIWSIQHKLRINRTMQPHRPTQARLSPSQPATPPQSCRSAISAISMYMPSIRSDLSKLPLHTSAARSIRGRGCLLGFVAYWMECSWNFMLDGAARTWGPEDVALTH